MADKYIVDRIIKGGVLGIAGVVDVEISHGVKRYSVSIMPSGRISAMVTFSRPYRKYGHSGTATVCRAVNPGPTLEKLGEVAVAALSNQ